MTNNIRTPINKPPRSRIVSIIKEDKEKRFLVKETIKSKWKYFAVEYKKDKLKKSLERMNTIADEIVMRQKLIHSTSMDNYLLSVGSIKRAANNRTITK